nr:MAG TPA: hypothetical protein [Caudoviricetes sp.]
MWYRPTEYLSFTSQHIVVRVKVSFICIKRTYICNKCSSLYS